MLDNNTYNLMAQLVEESQSLWRIKNTYKRDAGMCQECMDFWTRLEQDKERHVRDLEDLVAEHIRACEPAMASAGIRPETEPLTEREMLPRSRTYRR